MLFHTLSRPIAFIIKWNNIKVEKEFISVPASRYHVDDDDDDHNAHDQIKVKEKGTIHKFFLYSSTVSNSQNF